MTATTTTLALPGMSEPKIAGVSCPLHHPQQPDLCVLCRTADDISFRIQHERCRCQPWNCQWEHSDAGFIAACEWQGMSRERAERVLARYKELRARNG